MRHYDRNTNYLFVDGYNIINDWENLKALSKTSLEEARIALIDILIEYAHLTKEKIILVFDAYMVKKSGGKSYQKDGLEIVFTKEFETADHYIERELDKIGKLRNVRVATSDNTEQQLILARGGTRISARELEIEINHSKTMANYFAKELKTKTFKNFNEESLEILQRLKDELS